MEVAEKFIDNETISSDYDGEIKPLLVKDYIIQSKYGAGLNGTLKLQASTNGSDFDDVPGATKDITGSAGSVSWNITGASYGFIKEVFVWASGSGSLSAWFNTKDAK